MTKLKEIRERSECSEIIQGMYINILDIFNSSNKSFVSELQIKETYFELDPLVRYLSIKGLEEGSEENIEKLANIISIGAEAMANEFKDKYAFVLTKNSKLVCNGLETGGLRIVELPDKKIRIQWYIGLII